MDPVLYKPNRGTLWVAHIVYGLHALSILTGAVTAASVAGAFVFSMPSIIAVVLNYLFRSEASATFLETHFAWQIRTFWYAALALVMIVLVGMPLAFVGVGLVVWLAGFLVLGVWVFWRIAYGWLRLVRNEPLVL